MLPMNLLPRKLAIHPKDLKREHVQKVGFDPSKCFPTFYCTAYADPSVEAGPNDYSITLYPPKEMDCDFNFGFININDFKAAGTFANTTTDTYNIHIRDRAAVIQLVNLMKSFGRAIMVSYIDDPDCSWDEVVGKQLINFIRNTEGEVSADGHHFTSNVQAWYQPDGRMMDAETRGSNASFADNCKAAFLRGIQTSPDGYRFIYCSYANRSIDTILNEAFTGKDDIEKELMHLGFNCIADFITKRSPELSQIHTMSYTGAAQSLLAEGDIYALMLAKGDQSKLFDMRKYVSIGVSPNITDPSVANQVATACDPTKAEGFRSYMVWAGNSPAGLAMYQSMAKARSAPVPKPLHEIFYRPQVLASDQLFSKADEKSMSQRREHGGNRDHFKKAAAYQKSIGKIKGFTPKATAEAQLATAPPPQNSDAVAPSSSWSLSQMLGMS